MASKQTYPISTKKLPPPPPIMTSPRRKPVPSKKQSYSPSLVQFSCQQKRPRYALNLFSIIRLTLGAATTAGIPLCLIQAKSAEMGHLYSNILKLIFLAYSLMLSILDLIQFHHSKLPHRMEAMLDLLLAFSFLSFFVVGLVSRGPTSDVIYFIVSALHFFSFFNILLRAHRISQQLQQLSTLTLRDVEKGEVVKTTPASSPTAARSLPTPQNDHSPVGGEHRKTITQTITAIRSSCAELEGSNRWTIVSEKPVESR